MNENKFDIGGSMDILSYDLLRDKQNIDEQEAENKNKGSNVLMATAPKSMFDFGGGLDVFSRRQKNLDALHTLQGDPTPHAAVVKGYSFGGNLGTNSSDFSTGLTHIDAGGSHEKNPNDGVQVGVDPEGTPNLVEEGETIWNDYVFSARIKADAETKKKFHLPLKKDITYAEISKKLEKEIAERVNDPISEAGFKAQMQTLQEQQERHKQEMEAKRAKKAFEALSPEEQAAITQEAAQEEQISQQAAQEQAAEQQPQATPEELAMAEQAQQQADGSEAMVGQDAPMMAKGGKVNRFDIGGEIMKVLGMHTWSDFVKWAKENKAFDDSPEENSSFWDGVDGPDKIAWDVMLGNESFRKALSKDNPALAHALDNEYDFGKYKPGASTYNLDAFNKVLGEYTKSRKQGNTKGNYAIDKDFGLGDYKTIQELENSKGYKDYTKAILGAIERAKGIQWRRKDETKTGDYDNMEFRDGKTLSKEDYDLLYTLANTAEGTSTKDKGTPVPIFDNDSDKDGWSGLLDNALETVSRLRTDHKGGIFHLTPKGLTRGTQTKNYVINDDGKIEEIIGEVPKEWTAAGNYSWATPENDLTYNYYKRPAPTASKEAKTPEQKAAEESGKKVVPNLKNEKLRYAGLFGPAVGLGMQALGIGKPDYSGLDAAVNSANGPIERANYQPIGNYLTYRPMDIWYQQNALNAQARATDRALLNSNSPSRAAGLLASGYNSQLASGNLYRQALEYNDAQRKQVEDFNRATNMFNADAYNKLSMFNAGEQNRARQYGAQMAMHAANTKLDSDAGWYNGIYGNIAGLFKGISDLGKENAQHNMIAKMWADGLAGTATPDTYSASDSLEWVRENKKKVKTAKGGAIKRKKGKRRGLTI